MDTKMKCWVFLLVISCGNLVNTEDNIAMESEVNYHRTRFYKPPDNQRDEASQYRNNHGYDSQDNYPKKLSRPRQERENVYLNNNLASRAREPRDESPWEPSNYQPSSFREPATSQTRLPNKQMKKPKKYDDELAKQQFYNQRYPTYPSSIQAIQASQGIHDYPQPFHSEGSKKPEPEDSFLDITKPHLENIEENGSEGKFLGFTSFVEHFSEGDDNEEMATALKEGSLDDIKKIVPKSGMSFKIYHGGDVATPVEHREQTSSKPNPFKQQISNDQFQHFFSPNEVIKPSEPTISFKGNKWAKYLVRDENADYFEKPLPNRTPLSPERTKIRKHHDTKTVDTNPIPTPFSERDSRFVLRLQEEESRNVPQKTRVRSPQPTQPPERQNHKPDIVAEETRVYPQQHAPAPPPSEATSYIQDPIRFHKDEKNTEKEEDNSKSNEHYDLYPTRSTVQADKYRVSNNHQSQLFEEQQGSVWKPMEQSREKLAVSSEAEVQKPGSYVETVVVHSIPNKQETPNYHYDHLRSSEEIERPNKKYEKFDHSKAIQESTSFGITNVVDAHLKPEPLNSHHLNDINERSPVLFSHSSTVQHKEREKPINLQGVPKHIRKLVQKYADSLTKTFAKDESNRLEHDQPKSHAIRIPETNIRHHGLLQNLEFIPRPAALVANRPHKFEMETPVMTEEEFDQRFGNFPSLTTSKPSSRPSFSHNDLKFTQQLKSPTELASQYWSVPEHKYQLSSASSINEIEHLAKVKMLAEKVRDLLNHQTVKSDNLNELLAEASELEKRYPKEIHMGQIERPIPNWTDGKIHLSKDLKFRVNEMLAKTQGLNLDELKSYRGQSHDWLGNSRPKKMTKIKGIVFRPQDSNLKYDVKLTPSFLAQKREDETQTSKENIFIEEPKQTQDNRATANQQIPREHQQNVLLQSPNVQQSKPISVSASYQIERSQNVHLKR